MNAAENGATGERTHPDEISRRAFLRGLLPAVAAAAGVAGALGETAGAATAPPADRDAADRRDSRGFRHRRDDAAGGQSDGRSRQPCRNPEPARAPSPRSTPGAPWLIHSYSYDASGNLTIAGRNFIPGVPVRVVVHGEGSNDLGRHAIELTLRATPDARGRLTVTARGICPNLLTITATQPGIAPVILLPAFGGYACLVP